MKNEKILRLFGASKDSKSNPPPSFTAIKEATCGNSYIRRFKGVETMYCRRTSTTCESTRRRGMCP